MSIINAVRSGLYRVALFPTQNDRILTNKGRELKAAILSGKKTYGEYKNMCSDKLEELFDFGRIYSRSGFFTMNTLEKDLVNVENKDKDDAFFIYLGKKA